MFELLDNGNLKIDIGKYHFNKQITNDILNFIEDFCQGVGNNRPVSLYIETEDNQIFIVCNLKECYILDTKLKKIKIERIGLFEIGRNLYNDIKKQQVKIIKNIQEQIEELPELNEIYTTNLNSLKIMLDKMEEDFVFKKRNLNQCICEAINEALYLHSSSTIYDKLENVEMFRIYDYEKSYLISITKIRNNRKVELTVIDKNISEIAINIYKELLPKRKLLQTQILLDEMKENLKEYGVILI